MVTSREELRSMELVCSMTVFAFAIWGFYKYLDRVAKKSFNFNHAFVLKGMFRSKPASRFGERYHSFRSCELNMEEFYFEKYL
jgi:hypothetical protein